ncbi:hypothetical protein ACLB2K_002768 [Fragaria x ananassa]
MSAATSSYWCYRCSSFVTVSAAAGDSPVVCPDCGQQRWSSAIVEYDGGGGGGGDRPQNDINGMERSAVESLPTIEVNDQRPAVESLPTMEVCAVCIEALELGDEIRETPCKHTYHSRCIRQWLAHHTSCPICRHQLRRDSPAVGRLANGGRERPVVHTVMHGGRRRRGGGVRRFVGGLLSCFNCAVNSMGAVTW